MSDRHTIVIRVKEGKKTEVLFCSCCPPLTLEVRTYTNDPAAVAAARPAWWLPGGSCNASKFQRDEQGVFSSRYLEPDRDDE